MKVLVTGSNGFLGAALVRRLVERGDTRVIRCLHRPGSDVSRLEAVRAAYPGARLELCAGDLTSREDCARIVDDVELVHHCASAFRGRPAELFQNTVDASRNLLDAIVAAARPIGVVMVSSFGVYGTAALPEGTTVTEACPLEPHPEWRDTYSHAKRRQEQLFWDYHAQHGVPLTVVRPGVIYGPSGPPMSSRVGLRLPGVFLHLGRENLLPLTYVDNCADALIAASASPAAVGQAFNVVDDDPPTASQYLARYRREVQPLRVISLPLVATQLVSRAVEWCHARSGGRVPAVFTPYKTGCAWRSFQFDNRKLKSIGWTPAVSTEEGLRRTFTSLRTTRAASRDA
jgi:nucleoside-diphosphate-sugar epimerase